MYFDSDKNARSIIRRDIINDRVGSKLTPQAVERAVDFGASLTNNNLNWGQIKEASIKHVTNDILK